MSQQYFNSYPKQDPRTIEVGQAVQVISCNSWDFIDEGRVDKIIRAFTGGVTGFVISNKTQTTAYSLNNNRVEHPEYRPSDLSIAQTIVGNFVNEAMDNEACQQAVVDAWQIIQTNIDPLVEVGI